MRAVATERGLDAGTVQVLAYLDDVVVLVPPELAAEVLPAAQRVLGEVGLDLRPDKTQAWSPSAPCPPGLEEQWRPDGLTLVGVPLGEPLPADGLPDESDETRTDLGHEGYTAERCREVASRAATLLGKLAELPSLASPHLPAVQVGALLLRLCGVGKVTHLLRSNPPAYTQRAAAAFDKAVFEAYEELVELDPLTVAQAMQCRLPLRLGGRGLRSQEVAPAAWAASWAQCLAEVRERSGLACLGNLTDCSLPLAASCRDALAALQPAALGGTGADGPPTWEELAQRPRYKLQKAFTRSLDSKNYQTLLRTSSAEDQARLRSCGGPLAAGWQLATPAAPLQRLDDEDCKLIARALLGQDLAPAGALCCNRACAGARAQESPAVNLFAARLGTLSAARQAAAPRHGATTWSGPGSDCTPSADTAQRARCTCRAGTVGAGTARVAARAAQRQLPLRGLAALVARLWRRNGRRRSWTSRSKEQDSRAHTLM